MFSLILSIRGLQISLFATDERGLFRQSQDEVLGKLGEAITLSKIHHPNIIQVFDAGVIETNIGQCGYFTMEYVAGGSLANFWRSFGPEFVPIAEAVDIICQVCRGMSVAHSEQPPIIHRDIKPHNLLVGYDKNGLLVRIADFGLAKKVNPLTLMASSKGTPEFKPPECLSNVDSCASDIWSIGVTLYLMLTDRFPFPMKDRLELTSGKCWKPDLVPASHYNPGVDATLDAILARSLEKQSADRYPDAMAMLDDLKDWEPSATKIISKAKSNADEHKSALGTLTKFAKTDAEGMIAEALQLSKDAGKLMEAADLLEEALKKAPNLRQKYEYRIKLWRKGISG